MSIEGFVERLGRGTNVIELGSVFEEGAFVSLEVSEQQVEFSGFGVHGKTTHKQRPHLQHQH